MSKDIERRLLSAVVVHRDIQPALQAKVTADFFAGEEHAEVWKFVQGYYATYGEVPTPAAIKVEDPHYRIIKVKEPIEFYLDRFLAIRRKTVITEAMMTGAEKISGGDVDGAVVDIQSAILQTQMETSVLRDVNLVDTWEERIKDYEERKNMGRAMRGIPTGFNTLDYLLLGMQPEQLWTVIGLPKSGKSTLLLRVAINAWLAGYSPLLIGFEMSNEEQQSRFDAMLAGINHLDLLSGRVSNEDLEKLRKALRRKDDAHPFYLSHDASSSLTLTGVAGKIEQYRPDLLVIDGTYMMEDENGQEPNSPQALTNITRGLKRHCQRFKIPVLNATQALVSKYTKSTGLTSAAIGYSSSFAQDSDVIIGAESTEADDTIKLLRIVEARNAPKRSFMVQWDWEAGTFEEHAPEDGDDIPDMGTSAAAVGYGEDDDEDDEEEEAPRRRRRRIKA